MTAALITPTQVRARLKLEQSTTDAQLNEYIKAVHARIVRALGFDYPRDVQEWTLDTVVSSELILPGSGARRILSITENGTTLADDDYELDRDTGRKVYRLDSNGQLMHWAYGNRIVVVRYLPVHPPQDLIDAELIEVVRAYRAAQSGYADRAGPDGSTIPFKHGLGKDTMLTVEGLKKGDGVGVW